MRSALQCLDSVGMAMDSRMGGAIPHLPNSKRGVTIFRKTTNLNKQGKTRENGEKAIWKTEARMQATTI